MSIPVSTPQTAVSFIISKSPLEWLGKLAMQLWPYWDPNQSEWSWRVCVCVVCPTLALALCPSVSWYSSHTRDLHTEDEVSLELGSRRCVLWSDLCLAHSNPRREVNATIRLLGPMGLDRLEWEKNHLPAESSVAFFRGLECGTQPCHPCSIDCLMTENMQSPSNYHQD